MSRAEEYVVHTYVSDPAERVKGLGEVRLDIPAVAEAVAPLVAELAWNDESFSSGGIGTITEFRRHGDTLYQVFRPDGLFERLHMGGILGELQLQQIKERCWDGEKAGRKPSFDATVTRLGRKLARLAADNYLVIGGRLHERSLGPVFRCRDSSNTEMVDGEWTFVPSVELKWAPGTTAGRRALAVFGPGERELAERFAGAAGMPETRTTRVSAKDLRLIGSMPPPPDLRSVSIRLIAGAAFNLLGGIPLRRIPRPALAALHSLRARLADVYGIDPARLEGLPGSYNGTGFGFWDPFPDDEVAGLVHDALHAFADVHKLPGQEASRNIMVSGLETISPKPEASVLDADDEAAFASLGGFGR